MSGFIGYVDGFNTLSAPVGNAVYLLPVLRIVQITAFPITLFRKNHDGFVLVFGVYGNHSNHLILAVFQRYAANSYRVTAHRTNGFFVKTYGFTILSSNYHFALTAGHAYLHQFVTLTDLDGVNPTCANIAVSFQRGFLNSALFCAENDVIVLQIGILIQVINRNVGHDLVFLRYAYKVLDSPALIGLLSLRNFVNL